METIQNKAFLNADADITFIGNFPNLKTIGDNAFGNVTGKILFSGSAPKLTTIHADAFKGSEVEFKGNF